MTDTYELHERIAALRALPGGEFVARFAAHEIDHELRQIGYLLSDRLNKPPHFYEWLAFDAVRSNGYTDVTI